MMKLVIKLLFLCSFLFFGEYAHTSQAPFGYPGNALDGSAQAEYAAIHFKHAFFKQAPPSRRGHVKDFIKGTVVEENDDDNDDSAKKSSANTNDGIASFYRLVSANDAHCLSGPLPFCKHFPYASTSKFIIHCVIRI